MIRGSDEGSVVAVLEGFPLPVLDWVGVGVALTMLVSCVRAVFVLVAVGLIVWGAVVLGAVVSGASVEATTGTLVLAVFDREVVPEGATLGELSALAVLLVLPVAEETASVPVGVLLGLPDEEDTVPVFDPVLLAVLALFVLVDTPVLVPVGRELMFVFVEPSVFVLV